MEMLIDLPYNVCYNSIVKEIKVMNILGRIIYKTIWIVIGLPIALIGAIVLLFYPKESLNTIINWWKMLKEI